MFRILLLAAIISSAACAQNESKTKIAEFKNKHAESLKAWEAAKAACGNTYYYQLSCNGGEGPGSTLDVWVEKGKVVRTLLVVTDYYEKKELRRDATLRREFNDYPVCTIDEMYAFAEKEVFTADDKNNYIYFETDKNGILRVAATYPKNLADACLFGYDISKLETTNTSIYGTWKLIYGKENDKETDYTNFEIEGKKETFLVTFGEKGDFHFNLDANKCHHIFELKDEDSILIGKPGQGAKCTRLCCDNIRFDYGGLRQYKIENDKLYLESEKKEVVYIFTRS